jgi:hypothetical protein
VGHMNQYLAIFEVPIDFELNEFQRHNAMGMLNKYYIGKDKIGLNGFVPDKLKDSHYSVCRTYFKTITVGLCLDGRLEIIND